MCFRVHTSDGVTAVGESPFVDISHRRNERLSDFALIGIRLLHQGVEGHRTSGLTTHRCRTMFHDNLASGMDAPVSKELPAVERGVGTTAGNELRPIRLS